MEKLNFSVDINALPEQVWKTLWDDSTYRLWVAVFYEGSYAKSDWQEGSRILFLSPEGDGMVSRIARLIPNEFMAFEHLGEVKNGVEDFDTAKEKGWAGGKENYHLRATPAGTTLTVELDSMGEFADYFKNTFPKALDKLKSLVESAA